MTPWEADQAVKGSLFVPAFAGYSTFVLPLLRVYSLDCPIGLQIHFTCVSNFQLKCFHFDPM